MVRDENIAVVLKCVLEELNGPIRKEIQTPYNIGLLNAIISTLGRLVADADASREAARELLPAWEEIGSGFKKLGLGDAPVETGARNNPLQVVELITNTIQNNLLDVSKQEKLVTGLKNSDPAATAWFSQAATRLNQLLQSEEESFHRPKGKKGAKSVASNLDTLEQNLNSYLCRRFPSLPARPIKDFYLVPGGQIKRTVIFQLEDNPLLPTRLVLRQDMDMEYTGTTVVDEFVTIERVYELGLPVPRPILVEPGQDVLGDGGCFMIMTEVVDAKPAGTYFGEDRAVVGHTMGENFGKEVARAVAQLHGKTLEQSPDAGAKALQAQREKFSQFREKWQAQGKPAFSLGVDLGIAWMEANPLQGERPYCLRHGDLGSHNMMTRNGELAAIIDWELASMGDPAADLAQLKMMLLDFMIPWDEFKAIYLAEGGPPAAVDDHAVAYYSVWTYFFHTSMAVNLWENFNKGVRDDAQAAEVSSHAMARLTLYASRALANAIDLTARKCEPIN